MTVLAADTWAGAACIAAFGFALALFFVGMSIGVNMPEIVAAWRERRRK